MLVIDARCTCSKCPLDIEIRCMQQRALAVYLFTHIHVHSQVVSQYTCLLLSTCLQLQQSIFCSMQLSCFFFSSLRLFNEEALKDYKRFRKQEVRDLKEVLAAHIKTQIVLCKLVCLTAGHHLELLDYLVSQNITDTCFRGY